MLAGAHSWVRKALGIIMDGEQTGKLHQLYYHRLHHLRPPPLDHIWGVIDIIADTDFPDIHNGSVIHSTSGSRLIIPREGDIVRFYIQLSDSDVLDPITGRVDKNRMSAEKLLEVFGQRVASRFSVNERIFIAGDACHTHSPKAGEFSHNSFISCSANDRSGQGMNASMNDTHNLGNGMRISRFCLTGLSENFPIGNGKQRIADNDDGLSHEEFRRSIMGKSSELPWLIANSAFKINSGFISGIGVHYASSAIANGKHQQCAPHLIIGERMPPQIFICAADACPCEIQDMLPSDTRFKLLFFVGYLTEERVRELDALSDEMKYPSCFLQKYGYPTEGIAQSMFSVITIVSGDKEDVEFTRVPALLRPHWSNILLDDTDVTRRLGGGAYKGFGIDPSSVTLVIIRPDGYVGMIAPASALEDVDSYFAAFMIPRKGVLATQLPQTL
ncbi:hypothetical protein AZE42_06001 [Rhizopogon vesiculosus]|uniref:Phenol hydroxylase C-terminal dimerisation domain-containing protein n=1 Tax=Rhizopogon vesiculosus TaxID=180088 RepID=A0A1J8R4D3_9AGAM|nr:hypothetical protein AZE42_06001 [Rhizopogon vesiculosus]